MLQLDLIGSRRNDIDLGNFGRPQGYVLLRANIRKLQKGIRLT